MDVQSAALTCVNYNNGYNDWFLPSLDELNLIYENLYQTGIVTYNTEIVKIGIGHLQREPIAHLTQLVTSIL